MTPRATRLRVFRTARPAAPEWNLLKTGLQIAVFWSMLLYVIPTGLVALERALVIPAFSGPPETALWTTFATASVLGLASGYTMARQGAGTPLPLDCPAQLVTQGPYRYVRNPMAVAGLTQGACVAGLLGSWLTLGYVLLGGLLWNYVARPLEEAHMVAQFGEAFSRYRRSVNCWIPRRPSRR